MSNGINYDYIVEYIRSTISLSDDFMASLEEYAQKNHVPIVQSETAKFIQILGMIARPIRILEVGAAIGYSAILMSSFLKDGGKIITIERDPKMIEQAKINIDKAGLSDIIKILEGDALEILPNMKEEFDFIFIDAGKGHYQEFFEHSLRMLKSGGVIVSDNILFRGMIANDELVDRRNKTITKRMREFLYNICNDEHLDTSIIPIGDGIALTYKRS